MERRSSGSVCLTKISVFMSIAPFYGNYNNWRWLMTQLWKQTKSFWDEYEQNMYDLDQMLYKDLRDIIKFAKESKTITNADSGRFSLSLEFGGMNNKAYVFWYRAASYKTNRCESLRIHSLLHCHNSYITGLVKLNQNWDFTYCKSVVFSNCNFNSSELITKMMSELLPKFKHEVRFEKWIFQHNSANLLSFCYNCTSLFDVHNRYTEPEGGFKFDSESANFKTTNLTLVWDPLEEPNLEKLKLKLLSAMAVWGILKNVKTLQLGAEVLSKVFLLILFLDFEFSSMLSWFDQF